jgi:bleomycin hydrolase
MFNTKNSFKIQEVFNNEIEDMCSITNQKQSGRCWMFAGFNVIRNIVKKNLKIKDIELSESYLMFYDKLEKCNTTLDFVIKNVNEKVDSRLFRYILGMSGENDGGFWHYFVKLVKKYGICPKEVMGESYDSSHSDKMNELIDTILTKNIALIRKNADNINKMLEIKEKALNDVYKILAICIGLPVDEFTFDYEEVDDDKDKENKDDKDKNLKDSNENKDNEQNLSDNNDNEKSEENKNNEKNINDKDNEDEKNKKKNKRKKFISSKMTPKEFADKYLKENLDDYILLLNYPSEKYPFNQTYLNKMNINIIEDNEIQYKALNVDINVMKKAVIDSIKDNSPVWFACDVTIDANRYEGYLSTEVVNPSKTFNIDFNYDKVDRVELMNTECNHAMTFIGVHLENDNINKDVNSVEDDKKEGKDENDKKDEDKKECKDVEYKPIRWKVQNSWGDDRGKKGCFLMTDQWFTDYVYECVINKKYLSEEVVKNFEKEPIILDPWNVII